MAAHGRSRQTRASAETVWRVWSDPQSWQAWNPNVKRMEMNGPFVNDTTGVMHTPAGQAHQIRLKNIYPGQSFELETQAIPLTQFTFHCEVVPISSGGSTISQSLQMSGPLAFFFSPMAGERIAASFEPLLKGLSDKAEADAGGQAQASTQSTESTQRAHDQG
jgi:Polyketide cyclase / dehydrase and lipid transport